MFKSWVRSFDGKHARSRPEESMILAQSIANLVRLVSLGDVEAVSNALQTGLGLQRETVFRILLTYLPRALCPGTYIALLKDIDDSPPVTPATSLTHGEIQATADQEALYFIRKLKLLPLAYPRMHLPCCDDDLLTHFLIHHAYNIDSEIHSLTQVLSLLQPFATHSVALQRWMTSILLPALHIDSLHEESPTLEGSLAKISQLDGSAAVAFFLDPAIFGSTNRQADTLERIKSIWAPWTIGATPTFVDESAGSRHEDYRKPWDCLFTWIFEQSQLNFDVAADILQRWGGPFDVNLGPWIASDSASSPQATKSIEREYVRLMLVTVLACQHDSQSTIDKCRAILGKAAQIQCLDGDALNGGVDISPWLADKSFENFDIAKHHTMIQSSCSIVSGSIESIQFLNTGISTAAALHHLGLRRSLLAICRMILKRDRHAQEALFEDILTNFRSTYVSDDKWMKNRELVLQLCNSQTGGYQYPAVLDMIEVKDVEIGLLRSMLLAGKYSLSGKIYCEAQSPLPSAIVEDTAVDMIRLAFNAATNGNKARGSMKKAAEAQRIYAARFPSSQALQELASLINAAHSLSFYTLKSAAGSMLLPIDIAKAKDPTLLIADLLNQNPRSYSHLEDLQDIGQNLVQAGIAIDDATTTCRRINRMAIEAALAEDDFDTAYSYIVTKIGGNTRTAARKPNTDYPTDDISWRAVYAAGQHPAAIGSSTELRRLEQRMEILSQALLLAPSSAIPDLLGVWQICETQMTSVLADDLLNGQDTVKSPKPLSYVPGLFPDEASPQSLSRTQAGRSILIDSAPLGLFDVARGAAAALSKNAFPLRVAPQIGSSDMQKDQLGQRADESRDADDNLVSHDSDRVRKRDMVSNLVTGGLASGIGWVIALDKSIPLTFHKELPLFSKMQTIDI